MSRSKRRSENASVCAEALQGEQAAAADNGRDARGRFAPGNAGGPGNPFARRVAELRKVLLETVTDDELRIVAGQLMVKAKMGDLAATKLLFQYVLGKPAATVDPDTVDVQEVELYRRAPVHGEVNDVLTARMPAELAAGLMRRVVPYVGQEHAKLMFEAITDPEAFAGDPYDLDYLDDEDDEDDEELEEEERPVAERGGPAPSTNPAMWVEDDSGRDGASLGSPGGDFLRGRREEIAEGHGITLGRWAASPFRQRGT